MEVNMEFDTKLPIYQQMINIFEKMIISGELSPGEKMPSARDMALTYSINPNTAARIYNEMEQMGVVFTKRGQGTFVTEDSDVISKLKHVYVKKIFDDLFNELVTLKFERNEIEEIMKMYLDSMYGKV
jgi:GntR family transcriptional regulator